MRASIDRKRCTGHGLCYMTASDVFVDDEHGYGQVIAELGEVAQEHRDVAQHGADNCPERAITLS